MKTLIKSNSNNFVKGKKGYSTNTRNAGIIAIDAHIPKMYVDQTSLEEFDGTSKGKYVKGLEQDKMSFVSDREDIISMSLTSVSSLMKNYNLSYKDIGRLEVGTETLLDKSKSIKSSLMQLFEESGNFDVEGIDTVKKKLYK